MKIHFDMNGNIWAKGEEIILEEHIEVEMIEDVDLWRYKYDITTQTASILYPSMTSEEALAQLALDTTTSSETNATVPTLE